MTTMLSASEVAHGKALLARLQQGCNEVLLGQQELVDLCVIALCARGHVLLEGLPGLGKTELVKAIGRLLGLQFRRVQFTPDLLPSDITGGPILQDKGGERTFVFRPGPLFANVVLADEINRSSPKTQSALLEAMQERSVTVLGETHALPRPFFVLATQNPIELEGTYPLPEAQLDRFLFKVEVPSVSADVVLRILTTRRRGEPPTATSVFAPGELDELFRLVDGVFLPQAVAHWIARLLAACDPARAGVPEPVRQHVRWPASPRAAIAIAESARAAALLAGRPNVDFADVQRVAVAALAHRLVLRHEAVVAGVRARDVVAAVLGSVPMVDRSLAEAAR
ncbi:MAG: AAA family ATPase [Planctomycetes bacterium]|nr:AAA family ATPase [Planctomycetota bacterium]